VIAGDRISELFCSSLHYPCSCFVPLLGYSVIERFCSPFRISLQVNFPFFPSSSSSSVPVAPT
jgi:hypothetical protein